MKIIHEKDQYLQAAQPAWWRRSIPSIPFMAIAGRGQIDLNTAAAPPGSTAFGQTGRYVYRYLIHSPTRGDIDFIIDPFSREVGCGTAFGDYGRRLRRIHFRPMKSNGRRRR